MVMVTVMVKGEQVILITTIRNRTIECTKPITTAIHDVGGFHNPFTFGGILGFRNN